MHLPDGFIDGKTALTAAGLSTLGVGLALRRVQRQLPPRKVPLLGLAAAFLFAAQMVNFPVVGGTSGHLMGGVLVAALLGPSAAVVVVTTVLIVQCFLFADGGVLALGANILNMAIIDSVPGYALYRVVCRSLSGTRGRITAIAFAGWCATVLAAVSCAGQLAWSGTVPWRAGVVAMGSVHLFIGVGEGLISALVLLAVERTRPEMLANGAAAPPGSWAESAALGLIAALGIAAFVAPFCCPWPDGLERVAAQLGFQDRAVPALVPALAPDYQAPFPVSPAMATALGGAFGTLLVFGLALLLGRMLVPRSEDLKRS